MGDQEQEQREGCGPFCRCCGEPLGYVDHCGACGCEEFEERCPDQPYCRTCSPAARTYNHADPFGYDAAYHREIEGA